MIHRSLRFATFALGFTTVTASALAQTVSTDAAVSSHGVEDRARANYFEVGVFGGVILPSEDHRLVGAGFPHDLFEPIAPEIGARVAYFPLSFLGVELEAAAGPTKTEGGSAAGLWAARGHAILQLPGRALTPFALLGGGRMGAASNATGADSDPLLHFGIGGKLALDDFLGLRLDLRDNLTQKTDASNGALTHHPEALLGLAFTLDLHGKPKPAAPPPPDGDGDGVPDETDKCPQASGPAPDGCPPPPDSDGDGFIDDKDACPNEVGIAPVGCPDRDPDHDCIPLPLDRCPEQPGIAPDGCPDPDPDHDGVSGAADQCPNDPETKNAFEDTDGCPDTLPERVKKYSGVIPGIEFDLGKATIRPISRAALDDAVSVLKEYPALRIGISGHTDDTGDRQQNLDLSRQRAEAVKAYLVEKGVDQSRIEARGAGPEEPLADNKTAAGRQKNRRIEFKLLPDALPAHD